MAQTPAIDEKLWVTNGEVFSEVISGNTIYIGGSFTQIKPYTGRGAALNNTNGNYDNSMPKANGTIRAVIPDGSGGWYIGGDFTSIGGVARNRLAHINADKSVDAIWNPNVNKTVYTITLLSNILYVGGNFTSVNGSTSRNRLAAFDLTNGTTTSWNPNIDGIVRALVISGNTIYAGGSFTSVNGGTTRNRLAAFDLTTETATSWDPNASGSAYSLAISSSTIYTAGSFTTVNGATTRKRLAAFDLINGTVKNWDPNASNTVRTIAISGSTIYVGGDFVTVNGGTSRKRLASFDLTNGTVTNWDPNVNDLVYALTISGSTIYVSGKFTMVNGLTTRNRLAAFDLTNGTTTGWDPNANDKVWSLAISNSIIYAGGEFTSVNESVTRNNLAAFDLTTSTYTSWDPNSNGRVNILAISGSTIYTGGFLTTVNGNKTRNNLAAFDLINGTTTSWNPNVNGEVYAIAISGATVYTGGGFTKANGTITRNRLASFGLTTGTITSWNPNADNLVFALAISGNTIYAGGQFDVVDGSTTRNRAAAFDLTNGTVTGWNPNIGGDVRSMVISGSIIYVGGAFTNVSGGTTRNRIAAFDLTNGTLTGWDPNLSNTPFTLVISGSTIYAGGTFTVVNGSTARSRIASFDINSGTVTSWDPNSNLTVRALAISGNTVYTGGDFTTIANSDNTYFIGINDPSLITTPTPQASNITFNNIQTTSATISWTNGNGSNRAVFVKQGNSGTAAPVDNTIYTANTSFGTGTQIGATGWYNVFNGTGNNFNITNLTPGTTYQAMVVEYNGTAGDEIYNRSTAINNPNNFSTTISTPTLSSPLNAATGQALNVTLSWSSVTGADEYTLEVNTASDFTGTALTVSNQPQSGTSKTPGGLSDNTTYYWRVTASNSNTGNTSNASMVRSFTTVQQSVTGISPVENSFSNSLTPTLTWPAGPTGTDTYRLEVNTASDFTGTSKLDTTTSGTSKTLNGTSLSNNTKYYWRVTAQSNLAKVGTSVTNSFTTKPAAPTLTSPANGATGQALNVSLSWGSISGADQYTLEVNTASDFTGTTLTVSNQPQPGTSKAPGGLSDNTTYYWRVTASNSGTGNTSNASLVRSFTTAQQSVTGISPAENSFSISLSPTLSWPATTGADKYRLEVNTASDFTGTVVIDTTTSGTSKTINGTTLAYNTKYYWRVTAQSNLAKVSTSATNSFTTKLAPAVLASPVDGGTGQALNVSLSWDSVSGADKYTLEVNTASDFTGTALTVSNQPQPGTSKAPGGLSDNTTYYWRVTASNSGTGNTSDVSSVRSFTTAQQSVVGISPAENSFNNSLTPILSWPAGPTGTDTYRLEVNTALDFTGTVVFDDDALTTNSQALSGLSNNTTYYWRVTAQSNLAKVSTSATNSFTTKPAAPTLTSPADAATGQALNVSLSWSSVTGADRYTLEVNTASDFTGTAINVGGQPQSGTSKAPGGLSDS
ncbi:MAG: hypothetical protein IIA48_08685, partial [Bacteroidetes bacterium]|nr:hypothetical protein [Bacteroidota bacterium]